MGDELDTDPRIDLALELITRIAVGEHEARAALTGTGDGLDGILSGLNMLAEELASRAERVERAESLLDDALAAYDEAPALMCSIDATTHRVVKANQTLSRALGLPRDQVLGLRLRELLTPPSLVVASSLLGRAARHRGHPSDELQLARRERPPLPVRATVSAVGERGGPASRFRLVLQDVSGERRLEKQLAHAQRLEPLARFAGGIAHDFNNLLTVIIAAAEFVRSAENLHEAKSAIADVFDAANSASELTRSLLAFAREDRPPAAEVSIDDEFRRLKRLLRRLVRENIDLRISREPDVGHVRIDPGRLEQVIVNLVINAVDAIGDGAGSIEVHAARSRERLVTGDEPMGSVRIRVRDDGCGMNEETRSRALDPFYTTKPPGRGTGLGLPTCYGIIRQAGGNLVIESAPDRGTTVDVVLPAVREPAPSAEPRSEPAPTRRLRILVVEDSDGVRRAMIRMLRGAGHEAVGATGGADALEIAQRSEHPFDVLVTDVVMPGLAGPQIAQALKPSCPGLRTLYVSGHSPELAFDGIDRQHEHYLSKPFTREIFLEALGELTERRPPSEGPPPESI